MGLALLRVWWHPKAVPRREKEAVLRPGNGLRHGTVKWVLRRDEGAVSL